MFATVGCHSKHVLATGLAALGLALSASAGTALAGSIVINNAAPDSSLQYRDDAGKVKDLVVTWSDLQLISKVKGFLVSKFGEQGRVMPYMIDRATQTVNVLVDRSAGRYESFGFAQLNAF